MPEVDCFSINEALGSWSAICSTSFIILVMSHQRLQGAVSGSTNMDW